MNTMSTLASLSPIVSSAVFHGVGSLVPRDGRFLCGIRPLRREHDDLIAQVTAIGGGLEAYDASFMAGALRESLEEINCPICFQSCAETLFVHGPAQVQWQRLADPMGPAAVVFRHWHTPPRRPWHVPHDGWQCLVLYQAALAGTPCPSQELPGLIWLWPAQIVALAHADVPLQTLLDQGALLLEDPQLPLARSACARLTDSQEALVLGLGSEALAFYTSLAAGRLA